MSDPTAILQHILASVQELKAGQADLQSQFNALKISVAPPGPPPPLPDALDAESASALAAHPYLADCDRVFAQVLRIAQPLVLAEEDQAILHEAYKLLVERVAESMAVTAPPSPAQPRTSTPLRSAHVYTAKSGRTFDTRRPPPYPCRQCHHYHWVSGPGATPCHSAPPSSSQPFSRRGAHSPAPAPRHAPSAGSTSQ